MCPSFRRVTDIAWSRQVAFGPFVAGNASRLERLLPFDVAFGTGYVLVSTHKLDRVVGNSRSLETDGCMAVRAVGTIVGFPWCLMATGTLVLCRSVERQVAVEALCLRMLAHQLWLVRIGFHFGPHLGREMAIVALEARYRCVGGDVARVTVSELAVKLAGKVTVEADAHRADDAAAHWVEAMADTSVTVTAGYIGELTMCDLVMWRTQPVLWELFRQIPVAGQA